METQRGDNFFPSEDTWPFLLRQTDLARSNEFLVPPGSFARVLRIFGQSGVGKSFLARELLVRASTTAAKAIGLYIDIAPSELEASAVFDKLDALLSTSQRTTRSAPSFVDKQTSSAWSARKKGRPSGRSEYLYRVLRDLTAQIPALGPFIKAVLPPSVPAGILAGDECSPLQFVMRCSHSRPVFLVFDNIQFLSVTLRERLDSYLATAGKNLRLLLIERVLGPHRVDWMPPVPEARALDIELGPASLGEIEALVTAVLPNADDSHSLASTIHRRSEGNLKSVWFQLRFVAARRKVQAAAPRSYENVVSSLSPTDQTILRIVVFTLGGLSIAGLAALVQASRLHISSEHVPAAVADLTALGLLIVNSDRHDRVRVEHELVSQVVNDLTPEDEKLELREHIVSAISAVLETGSHSNDQSVLYDRLLGIVHEVELRGRPALLAHIVRFIDGESDRENFGYLASLCRDSVCWEVLDALPRHTVQIFLDAVQKCSLFSFGLIAAAGIGRSAHHRDLAALYEAKYLVQLFRYEEAEHALTSASESKEKESVRFNILLNLRKDDAAAQIAAQIYAELSRSSATKQDFLILRNSGHLFPPADARVLVEAALEGFRAIGSRFGVATSLNNLGIVELFAGHHHTAAAHFENARSMLVDLESREVYQPLVNLSALAAQAGRLPDAKELLRKARDAAPTSLAMDSAMLELNDIVLGLLSGERLDDLMLQRVQNVAAAARKTRDLRFIDLASWFAASIEKRAGGSDSELSVEIARMRDGARVGIELFLPIKSGTLQVEAPYMLSPHWRY